MKIWYHTSVKSICNFISKYARELGFIVYIKWYDNTESRYIHISRNDNRFKGIKLRISNHQPVSNNEKDLIDIYAEFFRQNALNYIQFIERLAKVTNSKVPPAINYIGSKSKYYIKYLHEMNKRSFIENRKSIFNDSFLYID